MALGRVRACVASLAAGSGRAYEASMSGSRVAPADRVLAAFARAPRVERLTPEQRAELDQAMADIQSGRARIVPHDEVPAVLEELDGEA